MAHAENPTGWALDEDGNYRDADQMSFTFSESEERNSIPAPQNTAPSVQKLNGFQKGTLVEAPVTAENVVVGQRVLRSRTNSAWRVTTKPTRSKKTTDKRAKGPTKKKQNIVESEDSENEDENFLKQDTSTEDDSDNDNDNDNYQEHLEKRRTAEEKAKCNVRSRDTRTDDIRGIFTETTREVGGVEKKGHLCNICRKQGHSKALSFMTGGISTLRTHIARTEGHYAIYLEKCKKISAKPHDRAKPKRKLKGESEDMEENGGDAQAAVIAPWTRDGLMDHIVQLIVQDDSAFNVVERPAFRQLLRYLRPKMVERDIPHRTALRQEIMAKAKRVTEQTIGRLASVPGQISATFDAWTSGAGDAYLSFTVHYITAPPDQPNEWKLVHEVLAMPHLIGGHSGVNQGDIILRVINQYELGEKLGWVTTDNAMSNDIAMQRIECKLPPYRRYPWYSNERRIRCMEHACHLAARHFIEKISPTPSRLIKSNLLSKRRKQQERRRSTVVHYTLDDSASDDDGCQIEDVELVDAFDDTNIEVSGGQGGTKGDAAAVAMEEWEGSEREVDPGDVVGKALALVEQIRKSTDARAYLHELCERDNLPALELVRWVRTRWASLYHFFGCLLKLRPAIDKFILLADDSERVPNLTNKKYLDYKLDKREWTLINLMHQVLQEPASTHMAFASEEHPTIGIAIPLIEYLQTTWEALLQKADFKPVHSGIRAGLANLKKWYRKLDDTNVYFISLVLDPKMKLEYTKILWGEEYHNAGVESLKTLFDDYYEPPATPDPNDMSVELPESNSPKKARSYAVAWMNSTVQSRLRNQRNQRLHGNPRQELQDYLNSPLEPKCDNLVKWWGHHQEQYPTLARIAQDFLAIQGSSIASERLFSSAALTGVNRRNRLSPPTFEALQILKSAYKNKFISADDESALHAARLWNKDDKEMVLDFQSAF